MTVLHKSTMAMRRLGIAVHRLQQRKYTQLTHTMHRLSESAGATSSVSKNSDWVFIPVAIALFGLGFSTFSTHRLMSCKEGGIPIGNIKKA